MDRSEHGTGFTLNGPENAPLVVLIHGVGLCSAVFDAALPALVKRYRVLSYDLLGHGASIAAPKGACLADFADQLSVLMDDLGFTSAHIVGFSIGGMINRRFALDFPERTSSLVIVNSPHERTDDAQAAIEARADAVETQGVLATMEAAITRWFTPEFLLTHPEAGQLVTDWRLAADGPSYADAYRVLARGVTELIKPNPPITAPTLVITGENDSGSTPEMTHAIVREIMGAQALIIPKLQHLGLMEKPDAFTAPIIDFIGNCEAG